MNGISIVYRLIFSNILIYINTRRICLIFILASLSLVSIGEDSLNSSDTSDCEVTAISVEKNGKVIEKTVPAVFKVNYKERIDGVPSVFVELTRLGDAGLIRINKKQLPPGFAGLTGIRDNFYFEIFPDTAYNITLSLIKPAAGRYLKSMPEKVTILDARGNPAKDFIVEFSGYILNKRKHFWGVIKKETLNSSGEFIVPLIQTPQHHHIGSPD